MSRLSLTISLLFIGSVLFAQSGIDHDKLNTELDRFELELLYLYIKDNSELTKHKTVDPDENQRVNGGFEYLREQRDADWKSDDIIAIRTNLKDKFSWGLTAGRIKGIIDALQKKCDNLQQLDELNTVLSEFAYAKRDPSTFSYRLFNHVQEHNPGKLNELVSGIASQVAIEDSSADKALDADSRNASAEAIENKAKRVIQDPQSKANTPSGEVQVPQINSSHRLSRVFTVLWIVAGLVIGFLFGWFSKRPKIVYEKSRSSGQGGSRKTDWERAVSSNSREPQISNKKVAGLEQEIVSLKEENKHLKKEIDELEQAKKVIVSPSNPAHDSSEADDKKVVYLSSPSEGGTFSNLYETPSIGNRSYFEFVLTSENTADFRFIDDISIQKKAIDTFGGRISEIAEELNWIEAQTKGIKVEKVGKAVRDGENWKVVSKAKIRYI